MPFYVAPRDDESDAEFLRSITPGGGRRTVTHGMWTSVLPTECTLPQQGWKIHVSATMENARTTLRIVDAYCLEQRVAYKVLRGRQALFSANSKEAHRASSGKFITMYPVSDDQLRRCLEDLHEQLGGSAGPYILSDLRWREGPLFLRYGGFQRIDVNDPDTGRPVPALRGPDGRLVPDRRIPAFIVPDWAPVPSFIEEQRERAAQQDDVFPYEVTDSLHYSNGGGVYLAKDPASGEFVVLKEARPFAGLDASGDDAVTRLASEARLLRDIDGTGIGPRVLREFKVWEHSYVALEHIDGVPLNMWVHNEHPWLRTSHRAQDLRDYVERADAICAWIDRSLDTLHGMGITFADLHPRNVMVGQDGEVRLIDFEAAGRGDDRIFFGAPGFEPPPGCGAFEADRWAAACVRLHLLLPLTTLGSVHAGKLLEFVEDLRRRGVAASYLEPAERVFRKSEAVAEFKVGEAHAIRPDDTDAMVRGVLAARGDDPAAPFPGDIAQFSSSGLSFAYGAAGVLAALKAAGAEDLDAQWRSLQREARLAADTAPIGLMDGSAGIDAVLASEGLLSEAEWQQGLARAQAQAFGSGWNLHAGAAGVAWHALSSARAGLVGALDACVAVAEGVWSLAQERAADPDEHNVGLFFGRSGPALLFAHLFEETRDDRWGERAEEMIRAELSRSRIHDEGLWLSDGPRLLPYIAGGSAGLGLAIIEFRRVTMSAAYDDELRAIDRACLCPFFIQSGLYGGRAGILAYLVHSYRHHDHIEWEAILEQVDRLRWHQFGFADGMLHAGDQLFRLSTDVATGTAGVARVLAALFDGTDIVAALLPGADAPARRPRELVKVSNRKGV